MKADWTHADEKITELLYSLGRSGVPTYAVYSPEENASPIVLSEILSQNLIENTIRKILENESKFEPKF